MDLEQYTRNKFDESVKRYGAKSVLGVFLTGKVNYGFSEDPADLEYITIYIPSFKQLMDGYRLDDKGLLDLRDIYFLNKGQLLELLFSNSYLINSQFQKVFVEIFLKNREQIGRYCDKIRLRQALERAEDAFENGDYFEGARLCIAAEIYASGARLEDCFHIQSPILRAYLEKANKEGLTEEEIESLLNNVENYMEEASEDIAIDIGELLKKGIIDLFRISLSDKAKDDAFEDCLTRTEKEAYNFLLTKLINGKGCVSVSKIVEESSISRPVFKNLMNKMVGKNIANIENRGMKGTYIELYE